MVFVLTGYNRNSKFDLVANGPKTAQKLRIERRSRMGALQFLQVELTEAGASIPLVVVSNARTTKGSQSGRLRGRRGIDTVAGGDPCTQCSCECEDAKSRGRSSANLV
jgi:hypothetical protein